MQSETAVQSAMKTMLEAIGTISVSINDWSILDKSKSDTPCIIIENADTRTARFRTVAGEADWSLRFGLYVRFSDWPTTLNLFRDYRETIWQQIKTAPGAILGLLVNSIRTDGEIISIYPPEINDPDIADPLFLMQYIVIDASEF